MNIAAELPFVGVVDDGVLYAALAALIVTVALAILWKSVGKGALIAIAFLILIVFFAMNR